MIYTIFEDNSNNDNIETYEGLSDTIKNWLETLSMPFEGYAIEIEPFEFKRRDGFIPFSRNKGGLDLITITDIRSLIGSGEHMGLSIEDWTNEHYNEAVQNVLKEGLEDGTEEFYEAVDELTSAEYDAIAWRVRIMYEGDGLLVVHAGYDKDAPYFRWNGKADLEIEVKFKNIEELEKKLKKLTKKVEKSQ